MIITKQLKVLADFKSLKKGDIVAVEWRRDVQKTKRTRTRFATYEVVDNLDSQTEIILQKSLNVYFNYSMFLNPEKYGVSNVRAITLINTSEGQ